MVTGHVDNLEVPQLIEKSFQLENNDQKELFSLLNFELKSNLSEEETKAELIKFANRDENSARKVELFLKFQNFSTDLDIISKHYLQYLVPQKLQSSIKQKSNKEEICSQIRNIFVKEKITEDELRHKIEIYKTVVNVEKIRDKSQIELFAINVWPDISEKIDKKQLLKKLSTELEHGRLTPEHVKKHLGSKSGKPKSSRSKSDNTRELVDEIRLLNAKVSLLENEVRIQNERISKFDILGNRLIENIAILNNSMDSHFSGFERKSIVGPTENLLKSTQKKFIDNDLSKPSSFDELIKGLRSEKIDDLSFLRDGLSIMVLHYMANVTKEIEWEVSLDQFHRVLCDEINKLGDLTSSSIEIQKISNPVSDRLNITDKKFDELLVKCYEKDLVRLEVGSPIYDDNPRFVRSGINKYFYVKLLKMVR